MRQEHINNKHLVLQLFKNFCYFSLFFLKREVKLMRLVCCLLPPPPPQITSESSSRFYKVQPGGNVIEDDLGAVRFNPFGFNHSKMGHIQTSEMNAKFLPVNVEP
jgi:hypothetical protein